MSQNKIKFDCIDELLQRQRAVNKLIESCNKELSKHKAELDRIELMLDTLGYYTKDEDDDFVDLGLSVLWGSVNVGVDTGTYYGTLYPPDNLEKNKNLYQQIPTRRQWQEFIDNTTGEPAFCNGVKGLKFTSTVEGYEDKSIFLPVTFDEEFQEEDSGGYYAIQAEYWYETPSKFVFTTNDYDDVLGREICVNASPRPLQARCVKTK